MIALKIIAFIILFAGAVLVFGATLIVNKFKVIDEVHCDYRDELSDDDYEKFKKDTAVLKIKKYGLYVITPAVILLIILYR